MGPTEKKVAVGLALVLVALVAAYVAMPNLGAKAAPTANPMGAPPAGPQAAAGGAGDAGCAPGGEGGQGGVVTQEFGKKGAKLEIVAVLPITHGCHTETEAELKKIHQAHANDIHLVIVDLFGPQGQEWIGKIGGGFRAVVAINGKTAFDLGGRQVVLEKQEGMTYNVSDLRPIVEAELRKAG